VINGWRNRRQTQRSDLTAQARNVYVSKLTTDGTSDRAKIRVTFYVENNSDHVVDEIWLICHSQLVHHDEHVSDFAHQLPPGHRLTVDRIVASNPGPFPLSLSDRLQVSASFTMRTATGGRSGRTVNSAHPLTSAHAKALPGDC
jgi:hypothetical protein